MKYGKEDFRRGQENWFRFLFLEWFNVVAAS
jgi:hypothetical protein